MGVVSIVGVMIMRDGELVGDAPVACRHGNRRGPMVSLCLPIVMLLQ